MALDESAALLRRGGPDHGKQAPGAEASTPPPIYDSVVSELTGTVATQWEPVRRALRADDFALQRRLLRVREQSGLPEEVTALRVLDVIAWMEGKAKGLGSRRQ